MDKKLQEYRRQQKRKELLQNIKSIFLGEGNSKVAAKNTKTDEVAEEIDSPEDEQPKTLVDTPTSSKTIYVIVPIWAVIYLYFIHIQFGTVFVILSSLAFIYYNTRTTAKQTGEMSAYSVFNKDCQAIQGTLKAEDFEKELRAGVMW